MSLSFSILIESVVVVSLSLSILIAVVLFKACLVVLQYIHVSVSLVDGNTVYIYLLFKACLVVLQYIYVSLVDGNTVYNTSCSKPVWWYYNIYLFLLLMVILYIIPLVQSLSGGITIYICFSC